MVVGVGVDVVELERIRATLQRHGDRFVERILTAGEQAYCARRKDPIPHIAARFAAKEAVLKALGTGWSQGIRWTDVEVLRDEIGPPSIALHGAADKAARQLADPPRVHISLTHDRGVAIAVAILER